MRHRNPIRAACFLWVCAAAAQDAPSPEPLGNRPVADVRYEPADQPLTAEQLARIVPLRPNEPADPARVRAAIKQLYATGRYEYVEVAAQPAPGGVSMVIRTRPQWFIGPVSVEGDIKDPPNLGQLAAAARLELGQPFTGDDLDRAVENIQGLLRRNGFFQATVVPHVERDPRYDQLSFTFLVQPGDRARLTTPVITGDLRMPGGELAAAADYKGWFRWKTATHENVQRGMRNIREEYEERDRLTARVELEKMAYDANSNRAQPVLRVEGGPKIEIETVGAKISRGKLKRYVPIFQQRAMDRDLLVMGARNLRDYFQSEGYFQAEVDFERRPAGPDLEQVVYVVTPGPRQKLVEVTIRGNRYFSTEDIRERIFLQPAGFLRLRHGRYSEGFVRRDEEAIRRLYQANGFRDVRVSTETIDDYKGERGDVAVVITIEEGPQYFVSELQLHGVQQLDSNEIIPTLASSEGQPFSEANVGLDRDMIISRYQSAGFPDVTFDWRMTPGPGPHQFRVAYFVSEGEKQYVRDVLVTGMRETSMRLLQPTIRLRPGDPLSWTQMGEMQRQLYDLGVFTRVDMAIQNPQGETNSKYALYSLKEGHRYAVAVGAGAEFARIGGSQTSLENPAGQTGFSPRVSFEITRFNMFGLGHSLGFKSRYSSLNRRALINYSAPRYRNVEGRNITVTALYDDLRDVRTFTARRLEGSAQLSQRFSKATMAFWRYTYRDSRVDESTLKINPLLVPLLSQPARVGILQANLVRDRRDDPTDARRGIYNTLDAGLATRAVGSRTNFARILARTSWYKTFNQHYVFATNTQFGWLGPFSVRPGVDPSQAVPLPERFFGGGNTSHRGFPDNQAGPRDPLTGFPVGGNALLFQNTELRFPFLSDNISGVLFHDMGNIYSSPSKISFRVNQRDETDFDYMVHAVGFGIRYRTPVGPIRIDLAYSVNPPSFFGFEGTRQELLFGQGRRELQRISRFQFFFSIGQAF